MTRPLIRDVLADRYASTAMLNIWSAEAKIVAQRQFWIAVMTAQRELGHDIPEAAIEDYERVVDEINLESIRERELKTRHDVKALIEEFNALAGHEYIHQGMTSRDLTENVEQMQLRDAMRLISFKVVSVLDRLIKRSLEYISQPLTGRSHNVAAQTIVVGKRFSNSAEELFRMSENLRNTLDSYPLRGIKGPMGTQQDMLELLGTKGKVDDLEQAVANHLQFEEVFVSVGQVYPRTLDASTLATLMQIAGAGSNFATTLRLAAGHELMTEGFKPGQVGSSAMPHKMNARSSERICGFYKVIAGYHDMVSRIAGDQWNEGDVSCSVVRRVALQGAFFAIDGLLETWITVLDELGIYPAVIDRELDRYLPFLATTNLLMAALKAGMGREEAHAIIKEHAVAAALLMREKGSETNTLIARLAADERFIVAAEILHASVKNPEAFIGLAAEQVQRVAQVVADLVDSYPDAPQYKPERIL